MCSDFQTLLVNFTKFKTPAYLFIRSVNHSVAAMSNYNNIDLWQMSRGSLTQQRSLWVTVVVVVQECLWLKTIRFSSQPEPTVSTFLVSKPHFCWWLISPALLQGAALALHRRTTGLLYCLTPHNEMERSMQKASESQQNDCKLFLNICFYDRRIQTSSHRGEFTEKEFFFFTLQQRHTYVV